MDLEQAFWGYPATAGKDGGRAIAKARQQDMSWKQLGSPRHEELRRLLIERRQKAGLTQQQVADRLGWGQKTVSKIERGSKRVTAVELVELAEALGFSAMAAIRRIAKAKQ
jgi:DNA-binding XRE family transcriptional regulator